MATRVQSVLSLILEARDSGMSAALRGTVGDLGKVAKAIKEVDDQQIGIDVDAGGLSELDGALGDLLGKLDPTGGALSDVVGKFGGLDGVLGKVSPKMAGTVLQFAKFAGPAGVAATAALAVGSALNTAAREAAVANSVLSKVEIQTGRSGKAFDDLSEQINDVAGTGAFGTFDVVAEQMAIIAQETGLAGDELEEAAKAALVVGENFDRGILETVRGANQVVTTFGDDYERVMDGITIALQRGVDSEEDLLDTLNEYSAPLAQAGFDYDDFIAKIVAGSEKGARNTDVIADALKEFSIRVQDQSKASVGALDDIGIGANDLFARFQSGETSVAESMDEVIRQLQSIEDPLARNAAGVALFGTTFENLGEDVIFALDTGAESLGEFEGAADRAFEVASSGLLVSEQRSAELGRQISVLVGEKVLPLKQAWIDTKNEFLERVIIRLEGPDESAVQSVNDLIADVKANDQVFANSLYGGFEQPQADFVAGSQAALDTVIAGYIGAGERQVAAAQATAEQLVASAAAAAQAEADAWLNNQVDQSFIGRAFAYEESIERIKAAREGALAIELSAESAVQSAFEATRTGIIGLRDEIGDDFYAGIRPDLLAADIDPLNAAIRENAREMNLGAIESAALEIALGDLSEEAINAKLQAAILEQGIGTLVSQFGAGEISAAQLKTEAGLLRDSLAEEFTAVFAEEGSEGVLSTASTLIGELEAVTASEFGITFTDNTADVQPNLDILKTRLSEVDQLNAEAFIGADATEAQAEVSASQTIIRGLVDDDYTLAIDADAEAAQGILDELVANTDLAIADPYTVQMNMDKLAADEGLATLVGDVDLATFEPYTFVMDGDNLAALTDTETVKQALLDATNPVYQFETDSNAENVLSNEINPLQSALSRLGGSTYTFRVQADTSGVPPWAIPQSPPPIEQFLNRIDGEVYKFGIEQEGLSGLPDVGGSVPGVAAVPGVSNVSGGGAGSGVSVVFAEGSVVVNGAGNGGDLSEEIKQAITDAIQEAAEVAAGVAFNG